MKTKFTVLALAALLFAGLPLATTSSGAVAVSVGIAPPVLPIYEQPFCPAPGYIWVPGYWAWGGFGYYWVPGAWILPPRVGFLWTPGYWGYRGGRYVFTDGYWGPTVGFYGGINYGYGYFGSGYYGGRWEGRTFLYNTAVTRVSPAIKTTYVNREVLKRAGGNRAAFNGPGGVQAKPTAQERAAARSEHVRATAAQRSRVEAARKDPALRARENKGKPGTDAVQAFHRQHDAAGSANNRRPGRAETASPAERSENRTRPAAERAAGQTRAGREGQRPRRETGAQNQGRAATAERPRRETSPQRANRATAAERKRPSASQTRQAQPRRAQPKKAQAPPRQLQRRAPATTRRGPAATRRGPAVKQTSRPGAGRGPAQAPERGKKKKPEKKKPGGG